jgi:hypothetical protein
MMTAQATAPAGPYAAAHEALGDLGYTAIPLLPKDKAPGQRRGARWVLMSEWPQFRDRAPTVFEKNAWGSWEGANIGIILGTPIGEHKLIAVDIDSLDPEEVETIRGACPASPMVKRGSKGLTLFFRGPPEIKSRGYKTAEKRGLCDLLTGNATRQTVVPPSIHPYGPTYTWLAGPVPAHDLPLFDETCLERLEDTLAHLGWGGEAEVQARSTRKPMDTHDDDPSIWSEVNDAALSNMVAWVPALGLYGLRPVARGGYEAVATWRPSGSGQPIEKRKRNLKIYPDGIRDFGSDVGYSPLDLVCAANNWTLDDSFQWLRDRLDMVEAPVFVMPEPQVKETPESLHVGETCQQNPPSVNIAPVTPPVYQQQEGEIPADLLNVPGLVGKLADFITDSAIQPIRLHSLGAALCIVGTAAGRKYAGPTRSGTHLYVLALAPTGAGKNHPLTACTDILTAANMPRERGPSQFMSYSAVVKRLERHPLFLCAIDEFGSFLAKMNDKKSSSHEKGISQVLRTAWGNSYKTFMTPEYAAVPSVAISSPALSIYGASTHQEFYRALTSEDTTNGMLNRILVLSTTRRGDKVTPKVDASDYPPDVIFQLQDIYNSAPPLVSATMHNGAADAPLFTATWGEGAKEIYTEFAHRMGRRVDKDEWYARAAEYAVRLATIVAVGVDHRAPVVAKEFMTWAIAFSEWAFDRLVTEAGEHMAGSDFEVLCNEIMRIVKERKAVKKSEFTAAIRRVDGRTIQRALESLTEGGRLVGYRDPQSTAKTPALIYSAPS